MTQDITTMYHNIYYEASQMFVHCGYLTAFQLDLKEREREGCVWVGGLSLSTIFWILGTHLFKNSLFIFYFGHTFVHPKKLFLVIHLTYITFFPHNYIWQWILWNLMFILYLSVFFFCGIHCRIIICRLSKNLEINRWK